jgi:hypothetical protein
MPKGSIPEEMARDAAARIEAARASGEQLTFLPDEPGPAASGGRAARGKGKVTSMLRDHLAAKGFRMPEDVLAEMAAIASREDAVITAMAKTEQILAWAESGGREVTHVIKDGVLIEKELDRRPTTGQRLETFKFVFTAQLRAAEALLPYGLAKMTPDVTPTAPVQIIMPGASAPPAGPDQARDVTPRPSRLAPPPMPHEMQQNQQVAETTAPHSDATIRTDDA